MATTLLTLAYLVASVLFILALRGLSHPETSRQGNMFGMIGMAVAIVATLLKPGMDIGGIALVIAGLALGGTLGTVVAQRIQMTSLPQLVAAFHSLVGLAAVFVAAAAFYAPESFGIGTRGNIKGASLVGVFWGEFAKRQPLDNLNNMQRLTDWIAQGQVRPLVSQTRSLEDGPRALRDLLERRVTGKVVLIP